MRILLVISLFNLNLTFQFLFFINNLFLGVNLISEIIAVLILILILNLNDKYKMFLNNKIILNNKIHLINVKKIITLL